MCNVRNARPRSGAGLGILVVAVAAIAGCGSTPSVTTAPAGSAAAAASTSAGPPVQATAPAASILPVPSGRFAFDPESIVGYFRSIGSRCTERQPSATAAGYQFESCQLVDGDGRTRTLGLVTDPSDSVADASFSVRGAEGETILDPVAVLEPFGSFLGAFLGEEQGTALLPWLAGHLGDADARTTLGELTIATYTDTPEDHAKLTVEIANRTYLGAPAPS
jgi:hypothetical protein